MKNRKELKFLCDDRMLTVIENRIKGVMKRDKNQTGDHYNIRSIYFDSPNDRCFHENQAGVGSRVKYRIRIYEKSDALIKAEIKSKYFDTTHKESARLSKDQLAAFLQPGALPELLGDAAGTSFLRDESDTARKQAFETKKDIANRAILTFANKVIGEGYRPASIVEYERNAYVFQPCNVRVTFDRNIAASTDYDRFFAPQLCGRCVLDAGVHILEVKYDEFLPDFLLPLSIAAFSFER